MWADRLINLREINTLRNQIFVGFTLTMILVLTFAGAFIYEKVSVLLKESAEKHIQQTAIQANGRLDVLLKQIDSLTTQVVADSYVQKLLLKEVQGIPSNFNERQSLLQIANNYMAYSSGISSLELYRLDNRRLFPLDDSGTKRISENALAAADEKKGRIAWIGIDPRMPDTVLAIRRINLVDNSYLPGGYLVIHVNREYFDMYGPGVKNDPARSRELMLLSDSEGNPIISDIDDEAAQAVLAQTGSTVTIEQERMLAVRQHSEVAGWELVLLMPVEAATEGISVLRTALYVSIGIAAFAFLLLTLLLSTMITRPIQQLMRSMRGARFGGLRLIPAGRNHFRTLEINELNNTYNKMVTHMNELIQVVYEKEITQSRTELKALQAQINPHFLFNTLEAFYWSLEEKEESELAQTILAMSGLFRYVIGSAPGNDERVTIRDELEHAQRYLQIMKMRLIDRLHWNIDANEELLQVPIPKLIIQPLVENAILHGVESRISPGSVTIRVFSNKPGFATIAVIDDGLGMDQEALNKLMQSIEGVTSHDPKKGAGVAMSNVQRRLKLYYPSTAERGSGLQIESKAGVGTIVSFEITIPQEGLNCLENDIDC
ncbi:sensor histidine kinase [Paenibacillus albiflavus]|uniref:Sensor histidine kinase n=1 Tax=Paenibacillus albiflavus TaxID=2545760 RepID=A0A4R4E2Y1_9BACL|nr:sensor histidine kinase [Paenibacillus albiflavus]TCZ73816.1 sensor histidine kinase [Paenibacillus albiflavus]